MVGELRGPPASARRSGASAGRPAGSGFRNAGTPGLTACRLQEVAAHQDVGLAALLALVQHQLRRAFRMLASTAPRSCSFASCHSGTVVRQ